MTVIKLTILVALSAALGVAIAVVRFEMFEKHPHQPSSLEATEPAVLDKNAPRN